ncbi:MAG: hypothetical protein HC881_14240 [Leptolyngbyaceae cyanobacterium SL_7_1]|nr:hypothetical protein [Leptolyngbyaceae cyanobacterium SL_7_1]
MQLHQEAPTKGLDVLALQMSERARARGLQEILTEANINRFRGIAPDLVNQERSLRQQLRRLQSQWHQLATQLDSTADLNLSEQRRQTIEADITQLEREYETLREQYNTAQTAIRASDSDYSDLIQHEPLTLSALQENVLDEETVLLEYWLGERNSYLWVVSTTEIKTYILPGKAKIEEAAQQFYNSLTIPSQRIRPVRVARSGLSYLN